MKKGSQQQAVKTGIVALIEALKVSAKSKDLAGGRRIHQGLRGSDDLTNIYVQNTLIDMYSKCGSLADARQVFDKMSQRTVVSWTSLMLGYVQGGKEEIALELFQQMRCDGCGSDAQSFVAAIKACSGLAAKERGVSADGKSFVKAVSFKKAMRIHSEAAKVGFLSDVYVSNALIDLYCRCGKVAEADQVFRGMTLGRDAVSWTCLMLGYVNCGDCEIALHLFGVMQCEGCSPDGQAFVAALKACGGLIRTCDRSFTHRKIMAISWQAETSGFDSDIFVASAMVDAFARCGSMMDSRRIFDRMVSRDVVSWTVLIQGYTQNGQGQAALELFFRMQSEGYVPDSQTFVAALVSCAAVAEQEEFTQVVGVAGLLKLTSLETAMKLHSQAEKRGCESDLLVASTMVDLYAKCGSLADARRVFFRIPSPDVVAWTAMILGHVQSGEFRTAVEVFGRMCLQGCLPDSQAFAAALKACGGLAALEIGRSYHARICELDLDKDGLVASALVDFYCRCGSVEEAREVFDSSDHSAKDVVMWSSLIAGYSRRGDVESVVCVLGEMQEDGGLRPDGIVFTFVFAACSHAGLVEEGIEMFEMMKGKYGIVPEIEHYHGMVDLLGRANRIAEAVGVVREMPFKASVVSWMTVLAACEKWRNAEVGRVAFERLMELDEGLGSAYVLMANIYGSLGMRHEELKLRSGGRST